LLVPMAKRHFFALVWPVLLIWAIPRKKYSILIGMALAFLSADLLAFDPMIFQDYHQMIQLDNLQNKFMPKVSGVIRVLFFLHHFWAQFIPVAIGMTWADWYFWKRRNWWNWAERGSRLLVVRALVAPYTFMQDETALLPDVLQGVVWLSSARLELRSRLAVLLFACLNLLLLLIIRAKVDTFTGIYFWSSLVWFERYSYSNRFATSYGIQAAGDLSDVSAGVSDDLMA